MKKSESKMSVNLGARGWALAILGVLCFFMSGSSINDSLNVTLPMFKEMYGWDSAALSRIATYAGWIGALTMLPVGVVLNKFGARRVLICSEILLGVSVAALGFVQTIPAYFVLFTLITIGSDAIGLYAFGTLVGHWFPTRKGMVMGITTMGFNLGSCFACWILTMSWRAMGFSLGFLPYASITFIALIITLVFIREYPEECGGYPDNNKNMTREEADAILAEGLRYKKTSPWTTKKLLATPATWKIGLSLGLYSMVAVGIITHVVPILTARGFSETAALSGLTIAGALAMPFSLLLGAVDAKIGTRKAGTLMAAVTLVMLLVGMMDSKFGGVVVTITAAALMGWSNNLIVSEVTFVYGRYDVDKAMGVVYPIYMMCSAAGPGLVGTVSGTFGITTTLVVLAVVTVIVGIVQFTVPEKCIGRSDEAAAQQ